MFGFAIYAAAYGVTYAYRMHYLVNALCFWLFLVHLSNGPISLASLAQYITGSSPASAQPAAPSRQGKKRP